MGAVFISYRRGDSSGTAGRLYDRMTAALGRQRVFMDVDSIEPGLDFIEVLDRHLGECEVLLAVIGPHWLIANDAHGRRRIDDEADFVRLEIVGALSRGIRVIPILVDGAAPVSASDLPGELKALARRQAIEVRHERFGADTDQIADTLRKIMNEYPHAPVSKSTGAIGTWQGEIRHSHGLLKRTWILRQDGTMESPHNEFGFVENGRWQPSGDGIVVTLSSGSVYRGNVVGDVLSGTAETTSGAPGSFEMKRSH